MRIRITPLAAHDIAEAREWYQERGPLLGDRFEHALDETFDRIVEYPRAFPVVWRGTRRAAVANRFSAKQVFYRVDGEELKVVAVVHGSRHPKHWRRRV